MKTDGSFQTAEQLVVAVLRRDNVKGNLAGIKRRPAWALSRKLEKSHDIQISGKYQRWKE